MKKQYTPEERIWHLPPTPQCTQDLPWVQSYPGTVTHTHNEESPHHCPGHSPRRRKCDVREMRSQSKAEVVKSLVPSHRDNKSSIAHVVTPLSGAVFLQLCPWGACLLAYADFMFYTRPNKTKPLRADPESWILSMLPADAYVNLRLGVTAPSWWRVWRRKSWLLRNLSL